MPFDRLAGLAVASAILARAALRGKPRARSLAARLADFPARAPVAAAVAIHWNAYAIPFVEADREADLAVALGMVHAHLRLTQMELMRHLASGRVAELAGPLALRLDHALRLMDFPRAVPAIIAALAPETRAWAEGFVRGVNHIIAHAPPPPEFGMLGLPGAAPWTLADLFACARLAAADVNWLVWGRLLRVRAKMPPARWLALWPRLMAAGAPNPDSLLARAGSNAAAVAGSRTATGAALFAADPHLSVALPNIWLAVGMRCPGLNVVGLMPAGLPIVAIGRNARIAWGGTSLHHAASDLFDASGESLTERQVTLKVRGGRSRTLTLRESRLGPIVSDGMLLRAKTPLALRWLGHQPSDEMGAMLAVMKSATPDGFAAALRGFAIPGQNMLHATADGHIGHLLACAAPRRRSPPRDLVQPASAAAAWASLATTAEFLDRRDPPEGFVASANDAPPDGDVPVGFLFSPADRVTRLRALLGGTRKLDLGDLAATQADVQGSARAARGLAALLPEHVGGRVLHGWDGRYDVGSAGALVFEATMAALVRRLPEPTEVAAIAAVWHGRAALSAQVLALPDALLRPALQTALDQAMTLLRRQGGWGGVHAMPLRHYLAGLPVLGWRLRFGAYPSPGGNDTLNKTGHGPVRGRHRVSYGASARFLADMATGEAHMVLLGGQDGWLGSANFLDQVGLWRGGRTLTVALSPEAARAWPFHTALSPA